MQSVEFRVIKEFDVVKVKISKEVAERIERLQRENKCIACECEFQPGERKTVGIHADTCYQSQVYALRKGLVTLRELYANGERLAPKPGGRKPATAYAAKLLGREGEEAKAS